MAKYLKYLVCFILLIWVFWGFTINAIYKNDLRRNGILIKTCYITVWGKSNRGIYVDFFVNIKSDSFQKKNVESLSTGLRHNGDQFVYKYFPGVYSKKFNIVELLLLPEDFAKYGLPYPDSLRWVDSLHRGLKK